MGLRMHHDGVEKAKHSEKYRCPLQIGKEAVSVNTHAQIPNMEELYISSKRTIQGFLTYRQETVMNGKRNITDGRLWNVQTNMKR